MSLVEGTTSMHGLTFFRPILVAAVGFLSTPGRFLFLGRTQTVPGLSAFDVSRTDLTLDPIEPSWIKAGTPVARCVTLSESPDGLLTAGLWDCTAGTFTWIFRSDEIVHILEGEVRVHDDGTTHVLVPGSVAYFPRGRETVWEVPTYVKKSFTLRGPHRSPIRRAASAVKRRLVSSARTDTSPLRR
jgi:uncharacterized cupin superfamily protein